MSIYNDFYTFEDLQELTGRKRSKNMIEILNNMGIPFVTNAHGTPLVRRDYAAPKSKKANNDSANDDEFILPDVMKTT